MNELKLQDVPRFKPEETSTKVVVPIAVVAAIVELAIMGFNIVVQPRWDELFFSLLNSFVLALVVCMAYAILLYANRKPDRSRLFMAVIMPAFSLASILGTVEIAAHPLMETLLPAMGPVASALLDATAVTTLTMLLARWFEMVYSHSDLTDKRTSGRSGQIYRLVLLGIMSVMVLASVVTAVPGVWAQMTSRFNNSSTEIIDLVSRQRMLAQRLGRLTANVVQSDRDTRNEFLEISRAVADMREEAIKIDELLENSRRHLAAELSSPEFRAFHSQAQLDRSALLLEVDRFDIIQHKDGKSQAVTSNGKVQAIVDTYLKSEGVVLQHLREAINRIETSHTNLWVTWFVFSPLALFVIGFTTLGPIAAILRAQEIRLKTRAEKYEKLITAVGHSRSAVLLLDHAGRVVWVNAGVFNILGYSEESSVDRNICNLLSVCKAAPATLLKFRDSLDNAQPMELHGEIISLTGKTRHLDMELQIADGVGSVEKGFIAILSDVTDQVNMKNFLNAVFQGVAAGIVIQKESGEIIAANPEAERLLGLTHDQLLGRTSFDPNWRAIDVDGNDLPGEKHPAMIAIATNTPVSASVMGVEHGDGVRRWLLVNCSLSIDPASASRIVIASFSDITRDRERETELRLARDDAENNLSELESYRTALDQHAIVSVTDSNGIITDVNDAFVAISGYSREDILGRTHTMFNSGIHPPGFFGAMWKSLMAGQSWAAEICNKARDGSLYWVDSTIIPVRNGDDHKVRYVSIRYDITERVKAQEALFASSELARKKSAELEMTLAHMNQGISVYDKDGTITVWNSHYAEMFGMRQEQVKAGMNLAELLNVQKDNGNFEGDPLAFLNKIRDHVTDGRALIDVTAMGDGRLIKTIHSPTPEGGHVSTHEDVTERERANAAVQFAADHDILTGLPNRINITRNVARALETGLPLGERFSVMLVDLDRFKAVNDTFGHATGDKLLIAAAERMSACLRSGDVVARLGGDEFAVYFSSGQDQEGLIKTIAERMLQSLSKPYEIDGRSIHIGASIGAAIAPDHGKNVDSLFRAADNALYHVKANGKLSWRLFDAELAFKARNRREIETDLRLAIQNDEFRLHYQPYYSVSSGKITGVECLIRWNHPMRGMVPPDIFIPIAEDTGLIREIGDWVIRRAVADGVHWPEHIKIAVNASVAQFGHGQLTKTVSDALADFKLDPARLEIEVTETVLLRDDPILLAEMRRLKDMNISIALDDFGTGYSSLKHLKMFPFDKIKIDRSFVGDMLHNPQSAAIVGSITSLARSLDMSVTAEGVETNDQMHILKLAGCTFAQGYLMSRPLPFDEVTRFINNDLRDDGRDDRKSQFRVVT